MLGLRRYGFNAAAAKIGMALLEAADVMGGRLPETFAGYSRANTSYPAEYPTACSPQAWASGAPLMVISGLLGLKPEQSKLESSPDMPEKIRYLQLLNVPGRWGTTDVGINLDDKIVVELNDRVGPEAKKIAQIFEGIARRINPRNSVGRRMTIRINLEDKGIWRIVADNGKVSVDQRDEPSDVTFDMSLDMLTDILAGKQEINTAIMSGKVKVQGETALTVRAIRVLARPNETMMPLIPGGKMYRRAA
jgi:putative sterol carrier protein